MPHMRDVIEEMGHAISNRASSHFSEFTGKLEITQPIEHWAFNSSFVLAGKGLKIKKPTRSPKTRSHLIASNIVVDKTYSHPSDFMTPQLFSGPPSCALKVVFDNNSMPSSPWFVQSNASRRNMYRGDLLEAGEKELLRAGLMEFDGYAEGLAHSIHLFMHKYFRKGDVYTLVVNEDKLWMPQITLGPYKIVGRADAILTKNGIPTIIYEFKAPNSNMFSYTSYNDVGEKTILPKVNWVTQPGCYLQGFRAPLGKLVVVSGGTSHHMEQNITIENHSQPRAFNRKVLSSHIVARNMNPYSHEIIDEYYIPWRALEKGAIFLKTLEGVYNEYLKTLEYERFLKVIETGFAFAPVQKTEYPCCWAKDKVTKEYEEYCPYYAWCHEGLDPKEVFLVHYQK